MVVDSSILVAILLDEPGADADLQRLSAGPVAILSAVSRFEAAMVVLSRLGEAGLLRLDRLIEETSIQVEPFNNDHAHAALDAFRRFGKGRHPAGLNFGDCCAYAAARSQGFPLFYRGNDFARTDLSPVP